MTDDQVLLSSMVNAMKVLDGPWYEYQWCLNAVSVLQFCLFEAGWCCWPIGPGGLG